MEPVAITPAGAFTIGEPGRAATQLGSRRPTRFPDSADHELSESCVPGASVRAASMRGLMHRYRDQPRQDRYSVVFDAPTRTLIITVCDGVGQFALSQETAAFVAVDVPRAFLVHRDWHIAVAEVNDRLKEFVATAASRPHLDEVPDGARMATTLAAAAICLDPDDRRVSLAWTDDSSVWSLTAGRWQNLTPDPGASEDDGIYSGRVKALPNSSPRLATTELSLGEGPLFVMTDGLGVPLEGSAQVRETLADWWATPPDLFTFAQQVAFARKGHLDDRTVVGVWFESESS
jgi:serine/threonine protein phosphatase PrpC